MKDYFLQVMSDGGGSPSSLRWMSVLSLAVGVFIAVYGLLKGKDLSSLAVLVSVFVVSAFGGKVAQTHIENQ